MLHEAELRIKKLEKEALRQRYRVRGGCCFAVFPSSWVYPLSLDGFTPMENPNPIPKLWMVYKGLSENVGYIPNDS